jgi:diguanylate cyclase (GGDEF)-like protein/PAS domain S-box-containing protein
MPKPRLKLGVRFALMVSIVLLTTLGFTAAYLARLQTVASADYAEETARTFGSFVASISPDAVATEDLTTLDRYMSEVTRHPDVVYAYVLDAWESPITWHLDESDPLVRHALALEELAPGEMERVTEALGKQPEIRQLIQPVEQAGRVLGYLVTGLSLERTRSQSHALVLRQSLLYLGITVLLSLFIYLIFRLQVMRQVNGLRAGALRVAAGDLHTPVAVAGHDELGDLALCFNLMISELKSEQESLRKLSRAVEQSPSAVIITDPEGVIEYVNPRFTEVTGYTLEESRGRTPGLIKSDDTPGETYDELWSTIRQGRVWQGELRNRKKSGDLYWEYTIIAPLKSPDGEITHYIGLKEDISLRKEYEERLIRQASFDGLTGLPNRTLAMDRLRQLVKRARRDGHLVAVVFIDLDHFKDVNDTLGHEAGDRLLVEVARRLSETVREQDTVARLGGDEFLLVLPDIHDAEDARVVASKVLERIRAPVRIDARDCFTTASMGVTLFPGDSGDPDLLLKHADSAMYQAKESGRNTCTFFTAEINARIAHRVSLETELRNALKREQLFLEFQPVIRARDGALVGSEALLRWARPGHGVIAPEGFIGLAEQTGLIYDIGRWVLEAACRQCRQWQVTAGTETCVAVNISSRQFKSRHFPGIVKGMLDDTGLSGPSLHLEITERMLLDDDPQTIETLHKVKDLGAVLAIDDFGTGYSSLAYLKRFPVDVLKIDGAFIRDVPASSQDKALINAVVDLARGFDLATVAEGVEAREQYDWLVGLGVDMLQGHHISAPLGAEEFRGFHSYAVDACAVGIRPRPRFNGQG